MELTGAVREAARGDLASLSRIFDQNRSYFWDDLAGPHGALTICLIFFPETLSVAKFVHDLVSKSSLEEYYEDVSDEAYKLEVPSEQELKRVEALERYIDQESNRIGWTGGMNQWIKLRIKQVDHCLGVIDSSFLEYKLEEDTALWFDGVASTVSKFRTFYKHPLSIEQLESSTEEEAIGVLLGKSTFATVARDFEELAAPYLSYKHQQRGWAAVYKWVGEQHLETLVPIASHEELQHAIIAACYVSAESGKKVWSCLERISLSLHDESCQVEVTEEDFASYENLINSRLVRDSSTFTELVKSAAMIAERIPTATLGNVAKLKFLGTLDSQRALMHAYAVSAAGEWQEVYQNVVYLQESGIFGQVSTAVIDQEFIAHALRTASFDFLSEHFTPESLDKSSVLAAFDSFYDNATNGNKTRGGMRHAAQCLSLLPDSNEVSQRQSLLDATDELSKYSLTFTAGVPLKPVQIKHHDNDPLYIIHRVLELNPSAYQHSSHLTMIATKLLHGLSHPGYAAPDTVDVRVRGMCVDAALVAGDIDTAYSLCTAMSRLSESEVAWTACFQVGKYVSPAWGGSEGQYVPKGVLAKQVELLSGTLKICPRENIASVLKVWKLKDDQMWRIDGKVGVGVSPVREGSSSPEVPEREKGRGRERKRDQLSNMLVSGLGWAIGARE